MSAQLKRVRRPITPLCAFFALALSALCAAPAAAHHPGHDRGLGDGTYRDGRIPGQPDFQRVGDTTVRYLPGKGEYEVRWPGSPPVFMHDDTLLTELAMSEGEGEEEELEDYQLDPLCSSSGRRIVVVYSHRPEDTTPTPIAVLRTRVRWMNWKIANAFAISSEGARVGQMLVDCNGQGEIAIHDVASQDYSFSSVQSAVSEQLFGSPSGDEAVKYLIFDAHSAPSALGTLSIDNSKGPLNRNATETGFALNWGYLGANTVMIHELFHTLGAVQGTAKPPAPFSGSAHCIDGLDVMCYNDGGTWEGKGYSDEYCPASEGDGTGVTKPIDCGENTYFDADPEPGSYLDEYWNLAGPENPFLVAPPSEAETEAASAVRAQTARLHGSANPEGYDVTFEFEYGTSEEYGSVVRSTSPYPDGSVDFGAEVVEVSAPVDGLKPETTYHYRLVATNASGQADYGEDETFTTTSAWKLQQTDVLPETTTHMLRDVSCASTSECVAVGGAGSLGSQPHAQRWDGSEWSATASPAEGKYLADVSCPSTSFCMATPGEGLTSQVFDGEAWEAVSLASPAGEAEKIAPRDVSCTSAGACIAVGGYKASGTWYAFSESFDGEEWTLLSTPAGEESGNDDLNAVSCDAADSCTAVGRKDGITILLGEPVALRYDGEEWSALADPEGAAEASDLSCAGPSDCTAVFGAAQVERFDGEAWNASTLSAAEGGSSPKLNGVSCSSASACVAVGSFDPEGEAESAVLAQAWDGEGWSAQAPPSPEEGSELALRAVSCLNAYVCSAVDYYNTEGLHYESFAERYSRSPAASAEAASETFRRKAILNATVHPHGLPTTYRFETWRQDWQYVGSPTRTNLWNNPYGEGLSTEGILQNQQESVEAVELPDTTGLPAGIDTGFLVKGPSTNSKVGQTLDVTEGTTYRWSVYFRRKKDSIARTNLRVANTANFGSGGEVKASTSKFTEEAKGSFDRFDLEFTADETATWSLRVQSFVEDNEEYWLTAALVEVSEGLGPYFPNPAELESGQAVENEDATYTMATPIYAPASEAGDAGEGTEAVAVSETVEGLELAAPYRYRVVAANGEGGVYGRTLDFETTPHPPRLDAGSYPVSIDGEQSESDPLTLEVGAASIACDTAAFAGEAGAPSTTQDLQAELAGCSSEPGELEATVEMNSCDFQLGLLSARPAYRGTFGIGCDEAEDEIVIRVYEEEALKCTITYEAQEGAEGVALANVDQGGGWGIELDLEDVTLSADFQGGFFKCGVTNGVHPSRASGTLTLTAEDGEEAQVGLIVSGAPTVGVFISGEESEEEEAQPRFDAESHPLLLAGGQIASDPLTVQAGSATIACEEAYLQGEAQASGSSLSLDPELLGCEANGELETTVEVNSCRLEFGLLNSGPPYAGTLGVGCAEEGDAIVVKTHDEEGVLKCTISLEAQEGAEGVSLPNFGEAGERGIALDLDNVALSADYQGGVSKCGVTDGVHPALLLGGWNLYGFGGEEGEEGEEVITAAPEATTEAATEVTAETAKLNASVDANGLPTHYWFEHWREDWQEAEAPSRTNFALSPSAEGEYVGWESASEEVSVEATDKRIFDGAQAIKFVTPGNVGKEGIRVSVDVTEGFQPLPEGVGPGDPLTVSVYAWAQPGSSFHLYITTRKPGGTPTTLIGGYVYGTAEWRQYSATVAELPSNAEEIQIELRTNGTQAVTAWVDAAVFESVAEPKSYFPRISELESGQAVQNEDGTHTMAAPTYTPESKDGDAGEGTEPVNVSDAIEGLEPSTTYHFRVVAENGIGLVEGAEKTFTTE